MVDVKSNDKINSPDCWDGADIIGARNSQGDISM